MSLRRLASFAAVVPALLLACSSSAVSYTHLRAHETVLDLVCRLLLDKKMQTYQQDNNHKQSSTKQYTHTERGHQQRKILR